MTYDWEITEHTVTALDQPKEVQECNRVLQVKHYVPA